jgi:hypothetical protein
MPIVSTAEVPTQFIVEDKAGTVSGATCSGEWAGILIPHLSTA